MIIFYNCCYGCNCPTTFGCPSNTWKVIRLVTIVRVVLESEKKHIFALNCIIWASERERENRSVWLQELLLKGGSTFRGKTKNKKKENGVGKSKQLLFLLPSHSGKYRRRCRSLLPTLKEKCKLKTCFLMSFCGIWKASKQASIPLVYPESYQTFKFFRELPSTMCNLGYWVIFLYLFSSLLNSKQICQWLDSNPNIWRRKRTVS